MSRIAFLIGVAVLLAGVAPGCPSSGSTENGGGAEASVPEGARPAKELLDRYISLERAFDPSMADLYADDAIITNVRHYPDGQTRRMELSGAHVKELVRSAMPLAKARDDYSTYSGVRYDVADGRIRVTAERYSNLRKYKSPIAWVIAKGNDGTWRIVEEHSESRPS